MAKYVSKANGMLKHKLNYPVLFESSPHSCILYSVPLLHLFHAQMLCDINVVGLLVDHTYMYSTEMFCAGVSLA
jgi:hypothetical protein